MADHHCVGEFPEEMCRAPGVVHVYVGEQNVIEFFYVSCAKGCNENGNGACGSGVHEERAFRAAVEPGGYELRVTELGYVEVD